MSQFHLFDTVKLKERISITDENLPSDKNVAPAGTVGVIVEVLNQGEAYTVELFGDWVKYDEQENFVTATREDPDSFMETIGVETIYPYQIYLVKPAP